MFDLLLPATIRLTSGELVVDKSLNISGPGSQLLAISGNKASRVFRLGEDWGELMPNTVEISGLTIRDASGEFDGGGLRNQGAMLTLKEVSFVDNWSFENGGGMNNWKGNATLIGVNFSGNSATYGGGMSNDHGSFTIVDSRFNGNSATPMFGGGMYNDTSTGTLTNVVFSGNTAPAGGGMWNYLSSPVLTNVTFGGNWAEDGTAMLNEESNPIIQNSIIWDENAFNFYSGTPFITYSDVRGGYPGLGNIDADPMFVHPLEPTGVPTTAADLYLRWGSPAVNSGSNELVPQSVAADLDGNPRITFGTVDMGAYEVQLLSVRKSVKPDVDVPYRGPVTYTIVLKNNSPNDSTGIVLTDTLPVEVDFSYWVMQPMGADVVADELTWSGMIPGDQSLRYTLVVTHVGDYGDIVTNVAAYDHVSGTGTAEATFTVQPGRAYLPVMLRP